MEMNRRQFGTERNNSTLLCNQTESGVVGSIVPPQEPYSPEIRHHRATIHMFTTAAAAKSSSGPGMFTLLLYFINSCSFCLCNQRTTFISSVRCFGASLTPVILSVLQYNYTTYYTTCYTTCCKCLSTTLKSKLLHQMKICSKTVGQPPFRNWYRI